MPTFKTDDGNFCFANGRNGVIVSTFDVVGIVVMKVARENMRPINDAYDEFCRALRRLPEAIFGFSSLAKVDLDEAVGNLDSAVYQVLSCYHSLADASRGTYDWMDQPGARTLIGIRNARHHNLGSRIRGFVSMAFRGQISSTQSYWTVAYQPESQTSLPHYLPDIVEFLEHKENRLSKKRASEILDYLQVRETVEHFKSRGIEPSRLFFNLMPIISNGAKISIDAMGSDLEVLSFDGEVYLDHFPSIDYIEMASGLYSCLPSTLAGKPYGNPS
ncbi:hypothetical protein V8J82_11280 [Gymnodinialimonas sp. 2305UL16-5]|uniref:hypothetical protein n=1 Tax=Gymnodinialimonas mytili TaxID=3126503 RepID=UPI0030A7F261